MSDVLFLLLTWLLLWTTRWCGSCLVVTCIRKKNFNLWTVKEPNTKIHRYGRQALSWFESSKVVVDPYVSVIHRMSLHNTWVTCTCYVGTCLIALGIFLLPDVALRYGFCKWWIELNVIDNVRLSVAMTFLSLLASELFLLPVSGYGYKMVSVTVV